MAFSRFSALPDSGMAGARDNGHVAGSDVAYELGEGDIARRWLTLALVRVRKPNATAAVWTAISVVLNGIATLIGVIQTAVPALLIGP
jgi:hypothetical protein